MNRFNQKINETGQYPLRANKLDTLVVNFGLSKNLKSMYYYSQALNESIENISLENLDKILEILREQNISLVEITGTSPETHPHFKHFVKKAAEMGNKLAVVSNPAVYTEPGMEEMPHFLAEHKVKILAFVPHYDEEIVDRYTGKGTYGQIVSAFLTLNGIGYGKAESELTTAFVYFPAEPVPVTDRAVLRDAFINNYRERHGIEFNHFIVFNTFPIGRFAQENYIAGLLDDFNPDTLKNLPCRHALSIGPDGKLYDCDFMTAAGMPVKSPGRYLNNFDYDVLKSREVSGSEMCCICTAGEGATCAACFT